MYNDFNPDGGRNDMVNTFESLKECILYFQLTKDEEHDGKNDADIYDTNEHRWYSFIKNGEELTFYPEKTESITSLEAEKNVFAYLNSLVPMKVSGYLYSVI